MPATNYYSAKSEILGERSASGRLNYGVDALGSVTSSMSGDALQNTYQYKPYGGLLAKTGSGVDPKFLWVGTLGYRATGVQVSSHYVRARHYSDATGIWTTVDPVGDYTSRPYRCFRTNRISYNILFSLALTHPNSEGTRS